MSPQLRGLTNRFRWMLGVSKPHEIIECWRSYNIKDLAPRIRCPLLVLYGEAELAQSNERVALSALRFIKDLSGPVTIRMFGFDEGWAATHCQIGALATMQALEITYFSMRRITARSTCFGGSYSSAPQCLRPLLRTKSGSRGVLPHGLRVPRQEFPVWVNSMIAPRPHQNSPKTRPERTMKRPLKRSQKLR